jgi:RNA polymerase sigma-70 factor (ECF subfamily)
VSLLAVQQSTAAPSKRQHEWSATSNPTLPFGVDVPALVQAARRGDRAAFERLARAFMRPAYSVALAIVRRPSDAEDVAQDAILIALQRIDSCRNLDRFPAWLMTIVRNQARNWLDKRRLRDVSRDAPDESHVAAEDVVTVGDDERQRLLLALEALTAVEREVVLLHDLEGYTHEEIGATIGISTVMSRQHLFISRRKLREELEDSPSLQRTPE